MKKAKTILAVIMVMIFSNVALAVDWSDISTDSSDSNFSIRDGIGYMSTIDDVKKIEASNANVDVFEEYTSSISYKGNVAGYDDSQIWYYFHSDEPNDIYGIEYRIGAVSNGEKKYADVQSSLIKKYGKPFKKDVLQSTSTPSLYRGLQNGIVMHTQWFIEFKDCDVVITLTIKDFGSSFGGRSCFLKYDIFSFDEMEQIFAEAKRESEEQAKQRNTDF